ncbi:MAG: hypothetical protein ACRDSR_15865 [Pseudonocardiaceae bacterium]
MDISVPLLADALSVLQEDLVVHLCEAESLSTQVREWSDEEQDSARKVIGDLALLIRGLMMEHERQSGGDCRICSSAWPCPVMTTIHAVLKDPDREFVTLVHRVRDHTP